MVHSSFVKVFNRKMDAIFAFGVICFLGVSISALFISSFTQYSPLVSGIEIVNPDIINTPPIVPSMPPPPVNTEKAIIVSLKDQTLVYLEGDKIAGEFRISSGLPGTPTPPGEYTVLKKKPIVNYTGATYSFPVTKWNLMFKIGDGLNYYIHGAFWHHNFGHPMSHGCVNVSYGDMEGLYNWADEGTKITIIADSLQSVPFFDPGIFPTPPGVITPANVTGSSVNISWNAAVDPSGVAGYQIYQDGTLIATTSATKYAVNDLAPSIPYRFDVFAYNFLGSASFQPESVTVTTSSKVGIKKSGVTAGATTTNQISAPQAVPAVQPNLNPQADNASAEAADKLTGSLKSGDVINTQSSAGNLQELLNAIDQAISAASQ